MTTHLPEATALSLPARVVHFSRFLRLNGFDCDTASVLDAVTLLGLSGPVDRFHFKNLLRAAFSSSASQWQQFDGLYESFWRSLDDSDEESEDTNARYQDESGDQSGVQRNRLIGFSTSTDEQSAEQYAGGAGDFKTLSLADFRFVFDEAQMQQIETLIDNLARRTRRQRRQRHRATKQQARIDLRRSYRRSLATAGLPVSLAHHKPMQRLPAFLLLLDVSQSMEVYSRLFLRFVRQLMSQFERSNAFAFSNDLFPLAQGNKRLTEADIENALNAYGKGWLGGTKIAQSFASFNSQYLKREVNYKTTVVIFSDGYDTDNAEALLPELEVFRRRARRVIWVNPLAGRKKPGEPDPRMAPIRARVDAYCSGHNLVELEKLGALLVS